MSVLSQVTQLESSSARIQAQSGSRAFSLIPPGRVFIEVITVYWHCGTGLEGRPAIAWNGPI